MTASQRTPRLMQRAPALDPTPRRTSIAQNKWTRHPVGAFLVRGLVLLVPLIVSWFVVRWTGTIMGAPTSPLMAIVWWLGTIGSGFGAALVVDHFARRLLPLATLLQLTLLFPDQAPSRYRAWRKYRTEEELRRRIEHADSAGDAAVDVLALVAALDRHDRATRGHSERVRLFVELIAEQLRLSTDDRDLLRWGALLHDVGKLDVDHDVLNKPGKPSAEEWDALKAHPHAGLTHIGPLATWLGPWSMAIAHHHERHDGGGYPEGLVGDQISLAGRITSVADAFEVMTAARPYRRPVGPVAGREELVRHAGTQFDPAIVRAFLEVSLPRLRLALGPAAVLAQLPAIGFIARLPERPRIAIVALGASTLMAVVGGVPATADDGTFATTTIISAAEDGYGLQAPATGVTDPTGSTTDGAGSTTGAGAPAEQDEATSTGATSGGRPGSGDNPLTGAAEDGRTTSPTTTGNSPPSANGESTPDAEPTDDESAPAPSDNPDVARGSSRILVGGQGVDVALGLDENGLPFVELDPISDPAAPNEVGAGLLVQGAGAEAGLDDNGPYLRFILPVLRLLAALN